MESRLLEILVCPLCKGPLHYDRVNAELICQPEKLAFPVRDGIPIMLATEARSLAPGKDAQTAPDAAAQPTASTPDTTQPANTGAADSDNASDDASKS